MALPHNSSLQQWKDQRPPAANSIDTKQKRLQALLAEVDPSYTLDEEASELVLPLVEDFMHNVATHAAQVARHRGAQAIEHSDVAFTLLKQWNMAVPAVVPATSSQAAEGRGGGGGGGGKKGTKRKGR
jgi:transcription initiation factor TFIID subunit TAF12